MNALLTAEELFIWQDHFNTSRIRRAGCIM